MLHFWKKGLIKLNFGKGPSSKTEGMYKGQVTIKDIARELGISPSTVSKALKGHRDISPSTKKAVRELVEQVAL